MTLAAGIDVGGTKIDACVADPRTGEVFASERVPTLPERGGQAVLDDCVALVRQLADSYDLSSVGIGVCELVDGQGRVTSSVTIDWLGIDVAAGFAGVAPTTVVSDVRAAALAEARFGAGQAVSGPWIFVTVGTGISYCLVIDGRPFEGARGNAIVVGAPPAELVASGLALARAGGRARAEDVLTDPGSTAVVANGAAVLGSALAWLANALDPARIVVGGGLGLDAGYRDAAEHEMRPLIEAAGTREVSVVPASLGELAGPLGAAIAGAERASRRGR